MSFRKYGGLQYAAKSNIMSSNYNSINNLSISQGVGQPNSYINFLSDISGNITILGNLDLSGNLNVSGNIDCSSNLNVSGNIDCSSNLNVSGIVNAYEYYINGPYSYPYSDNSVVPKSYIDSISSGFQPKAGCVCATTPNNIIGSPPIYGTYDGTSNFTNVTYPLIIDSYQDLSLNDRVLIKNQTDSGDVSYNSIENGIYYISYIDTLSITSTCTLTRASDLAYDTSCAQVLVGIQSGAINKLSQWVQTNGTTNTQITVGINPLNFIKYAQVNLTIGQGLEYNVVNGKAILSVDPSLNFLTYVDISGNLDVTGVITGATGSFTYLSSFNNALINGVTVGISPGNNPGNSNTVFGINAMQVNGGGYQSTAIGYEALKRVVSSVNNTAVGSSCLRDNTTGTTNTGVGSGTLQGNTTGSNNTGVGLQALTSNYTGNNNTALGSLSLFSGATAYNGSNNTAVGCQSFFNKLQGGNNTALGYNAGYYDISGNSNTYLGYSSGQSSTDKSLYQYSTAIGANAVITASNQMMLGGNNGSNVYPQVVAPGGITGATGSFTYLSATQGLIGTSTGLTGGAALQIPYQSAPSNTTFITAPTEKGTVLTYNGSSFGWTGLTGFTGSSNWDSSGNNIYNNNTGNVGIGTTNPSFKLDVSGNLNVNGLINNPGFVILPLQYSSYGTTWTLLIQRIPILSPLNWESVAVSASGQYQTAVVFNGGIYYSNNYGFAWYQSNASTLNWHSVAVSDSGQYQTAVVDNGGIYLSIDYGVTWNQSTASIQFWYSVAVSASGQYQTAVVHLGGIYYSTNYGVTWIQSNASNLSWNSVAVSDSGQYQTAVVADTQNFGGIYYSNNYGVNWTQSSSAQTGPLWYSVAVSASGQYQTAVINGITGSGIGGIYYSRDYGVFWAKSNASIQFWNSVSVTSSGQYQTAVVQNGGIYYSNDYGLNWAQSTASTLNWYSVAVSASGQYQTAVVQNGGIYTSVIPCIANSIITNKITAPSDDGGIHFSGTQTFYYDSGILQSSSAGQAVSINSGANPQYLVALSSSIKTKENIVPLPDDRYNIENFMKLKPIQYTPKENFGDSNKNIGFIAEEVDEIGLNEVVCYNKDKTECISIYYERLTSFIVKIMQEQQKKIEELEDKINSMNQNV